MTYEYMFYEEERNWEDGPPSAVVGVFATWSF